MPVSMFFTFWATAALRRHSAPRSKNWLESAFGRLLPRGFTQLPLSHMNYLGAGPIMLRRVMRRKGVASLEEMLEISSDLGVRIHICAMSMDLLGIQREELITYPNMNFCGVSSFLEQAELGKLTMFV
jgi:peroxiredoxin family protein